MNEPNWLTELRAEKGDLDGKIQRLEKALETQPMLLSQYQLLRKQLIHMTLYSQVLGQRIIDAQPQEQAS